MQIYNTVGQQSSPHLLYAFFCYAMWMSQSTINTKTNWFATDFLKMAKIKKGSRTQTIKKICGASSTPKAHVHLESATLSAGTFLVVK